MDESLLVISRGFQKVLEILEIPDSLTDGIKKLHR
jgi:hypothetical protein